MSWHTKATNIKSFNQGFHEGQVEHRWWVSTDESSAPFLFLSPRPSHPRRWRPRRPYARRSVPFASCPLLPARADGANSGWEDGRHQNRHILPHAQPTSCNHLKTWSENARHAPDQRPPCLRVPASAQKPVQLPRWRAQFPTPGYAVPRCSPGPSPLRGHVVQQIRRIAHAVCLGSGECPPRAPEWISGDTPVSQHATPGCELLAKGLPCPSMWGRGRCLRSRCWSRKGEGTSVLRNPTAREGQGGTPLDGTHLLRRPHLLVAPPTFNDSTDGPQRAQRTSCAAWPEVDGAGLATRHHSPSHHRTHLGCLHCSSCGHGCWKHLQYFNQILPIVL